jgi:hypothetical protein
VTETAQVELWTSVSHCLGWNVILELPRVVIEERLAVVAQVEFESKYRRRFIML